ncbi:carboxylesterase [Candidatus Methylospira mobilis]|uniref:Carboxylesterase n=1 Tax=Candidatus Methylospira mobilis TaxID=1808979 RepID=A0A5Q0BCN4_9GAMM|nr:carboxylesterase [Candidatus Methylospira mobilis]QFY41625.1 carboxylesterase [Candidatus Methylospira mobilis]WNV05125.1 carboxylesterase [Candidatus Methylospira mobilis]
MTDKLLPCIEIEPKTPATASVIWLHGLGADGHDFEPVAKQLALPSDYAVRFIFPHAPRQPVTINGGYVMPAWYDIVAMDIDGARDPVGIGKSVDAIGRFVARERARGIAANLIILAGFSQGGVIALETAFASAEPLGGVMVLSSYLSDPDAVPVSPTRLPVFIAHGTDDTVVPYRLGIAARKKLTEQGYDVDWHEYAMQHSVCAHEIGDIRQWLLELLEE